MYKKQNLFEAEDIAQLASKLKEHANNQGIEPSDDAVLRIAADIYFNNTKNRLNEILVSAFAVSDKYPSALEAIALQMGYDKSIETSSIPGALNNIAEQLHELSNR